MVIWVIEDDKSSWEFQEEVIKDRIPTANIKFFLNAGYAAHSTGSPDFIILDVGGACALGNDLIALTVANVGGLSKKFPGTIFIIISALGDIAIDVIEEIKEREMELDSVVRTCFEYGMENVCDIIEEYNAT